MPEQGSEIHTENIIDLRYVADPSGKRSCQYYDTGNNMCQMHPGEDVDERLGSVVVDKYHSPAGQDSPSMDLHPEESEPQGNGHNQQGFLLTEIGAFCGGIGQLH